ncbi:MAG: SAM-dependent chlorinase/fluorinase [Betaproteobacteria bacterium]|nr:SAM-dependent chlorinase/fluorinase [Betaproteobacteria bacterium]
MTIVLFTDFGGADPYVGQVKAALLECAPGVEIIDLLHDVPAFSVRSGAHLLDSLKSFFPAGSTFLAVVDPGVGGARDALALDADGRHYIGPDNGLLSVVAARSLVRRWWRVLWRPRALSASFHGRDLFAPVAGLIAAGALPPEAREEIAAPAIDFGAGDAAEIIYIDHYGNAWTGLRAAGAPRDAILLASGARISHARVFAEARPGFAFWYENGQGLVEIAQNQGSAARSLGLSVGDLVSWSA